tara:strand:+ start:30 stop:302 length:273 start_codon:yes stop_codon:yes gene_type:complete
MTKKPYVAPNNYIPPEMVRTKDIALYQSPKSTAELLEERQKILDIRGKLNKDRKNRLTRIESVLVARDEAAEKELERLTKQSDTSHVKQA